MPSLRMPYGLTALVVLVLSHILLFQNRFLEVLRRIGPQGLAGRERGQRPFGVRRIGMDGKFLKELLENKILPVSSAENKLPCTDRGQLGNPTLLTRALPMLQAGCLRYDALARRRSIVVFLGVWASCG